MGGKRQVSSNRRQKRRSQARIPNWTGPHQKDCIAMPIMRGGEGGEIAEAHTRAALHMVNLELWCCYISYYNIIYIYIYPKGFFFSFFFSVFILCIDVI